MRYGEGRPRRDPVAAIFESYYEGVTDEFIKPIVIVDDAGKPTATVQDGDSVIFSTFARIARDKSLALHRSDFTFFDRGPKPDIRFTCMTYYDRQFSLPVAFDPNTFDQILADVSPELGSGIFASPRPKSMRISPFSSTAELSRRLPVKSGS